MIRTSLNRRFRRKIIRDFLMRFPITRMIPRNIRRGGVLEDIHSYMSYNHIPIFQFLRIPLKKMNIICVYVGMRWLIFRHHKINFK